MASFRDSIRAISPPFLQGKWGERYMYSIGILLDAVGTICREGVRARFAGIAPPDALPYLGRDRNITRGFQETDASYGDRLRYAFDAWRKAGTAWGLLMQLRGFFSPTFVKVRTVSNSSAWDTYETTDTDTINVAPTHAPPGVIPNWNWDGGGSAVWARVWPIIYPGSLIPRWKWGTIAGGGSGKKWGDGTTTWGTGMTHDQVRSLRAIVQRWKPLHSYVPAIIIAYDATIFDPALALGDPKLPDGSYASWGKFSGGVEVPNRLASASYIDGPGLIGVF